MEQSSNENSSQSSVASGGGGGNVDKLRTIKPFDERQLLNFYSNPLLEQKDRIVYDFLQKYQQNSTRLEFGLIENLEKSLERYNDTKRRVEQLTNQINDLESKCWTKKRVTIHKTARCADGTLVKADVSFDKYTFEEADFKDLDRYYYVLKETITNDHFYSQFHHKYYRLKFELKIYELTQVVKHLQSSQDEEDGQSVQVAKKSLLEWITALFAYYRKPSHGNDKLKEQAHHSLVILAKELHKIGTFEDRLFLLNHCLRCSSGSSTVLAGQLIDCPSPAQHGHEMGKEMVDYACTVISLVLSPITDRDKYIELEKKTLPQRNGKLQQAEPWLLVDTDYEDEELDSTSGGEMLNELDIINYLLQVPFEEVLDFVSLIGHQDDDEDAIASVETAMIKLFAFNTHLIRILKNGLQNFNCLRYKELTLYIASMVKLIIKKIADNWIWCREKFTTKDQAMLCRLQVEYDHFMLRSISTLLGTNRRGVWPLLAKINFEGITESMLWHILWVVYSNGQDVSTSSTSNMDKLNTLCAYMSTNYWKDKLAHFEQWKFVFLEKVSAFSKEEAVGLLEFLYKMAISRSDSGDLLQEIVNRIAELTLVKFKLSEEKTTGNHEFYAGKGQACLVKLMKKFPGSLMILLDFLEAQGEENLLDDACLNLFISFDLIDFIPEAKLMAKINRWLVNFEAKSLLNRSARIILSKLSWSRILFKADRLNSLFLSDEMQRMQALRLFEAVQAQQGFRNETDKEKVKTTMEEALPALELDKIGYDCFINQLAMGTNFNDFVLWSWRCLLELRIHPLATIPDASGWDEIMFGRDHFESIGGKQNGDHYVQHRLFQRLPQLSYETGLVELKKFQEGNPTAAFIATMMTDVIMKTGNVSGWIKVCSNLAKQGHNLLVVQLLKHFVPMFYAGASWTTKSGKKKYLINSNKFVAILVQLIGQGLGDVLAGIILYQVEHFTNPRSCVLLCSFWTEVLVLAVQRSLAEKGNGGWRIPLLSSLNPFATDGNAWIEIILNKVVNILDRLCQHLVAKSENHLMQNYIKYLLEKTSTINKTWRLSKLNNLPDHTSSGSILTNLFSFGGGSASEEDKIFKVSYLPDRSSLKSEWITPLHVLLRHNLNRRNKMDDEPAALYLAYVLIEFDMKRCAKVWDHLIYEIYNNPQLKQVIANDQVDEKMLSEFEGVLKNVCLLFNLPPLPFSMLPINSLLVWLLKAPPSSVKEALESEPHPMLPMLWKNFFVLYFSRSVSSPSLGPKFVARPAMEGLRDKLTKMFDLHSRRWLMMSNQKACSTSPMVANDSDLIASILFEDRLVKLYRSYQLWLGDSRLHRVYVDLSSDDYEKPEFQAELLKQIFAMGSNGSNHSVPEMNIEEDSSDVFFIHNYLDKKMLDVKRVTLETLSHEEHSSIGDDVDNDDEEEIYLNNKLKLTIEENRRQSSSLRDGETIMKDWLFWPIMEYINSLTNTLEVNALFADDDNVLHLLMPGGGAHNTNEPRMLITLMHQIIVSVVEEARLVESQWNKYTTENRVYCSDLLPKLYQEVSKRMTRNVECDRDTPTGGCTGSAALVFEYYESEMSNYVKQKADHNRLVQQSVIQHLSDEMPTQKIVGLVLLLQKMLNQLVSLYGVNEKTLLQQQVFGPLTNWFDSINTITTRYFVTTEVFDQLVGFLGQLGKLHTDEVNIFMLEMALNPKLSVNLIQQLAPCLVPLYCAPSCFVAMYKLIGSKLRNVAPQTAFVLLSKFDVSSWLSSVEVSDAQRTDFMLCLYGCLSNFGPCPSDDSLVTFDLYRKHLQDVILHRFPESFAKVLTFMLTGCHQRSLAPSLWNNVLQTFGFYTRSLSGEACKSVRSNNARSASSVLDFDFATFDQDVRDYTVRQQIFNSHQLFELLNDMASFFQQMNNELGGNELLEHYKLYTLRYLPFLTFMSYCWIRSNSGQRDTQDPEIIWRPLIANWKCWLLPTNSTKFIAAEHLDFAWQLFVKCFDFALDTFSNLRSGLLSKLWQFFFTFIIEQPNRIEKKELASIEEKLIAIRDWKYFTPTLMDIKLMSDSVIQTSYSVERLVAWVLARIDWTKTLTVQVGGAEMLTYEQLTTVVENLSYIFITLHDYDSIVELNLDSIPFGVLEPTKVKMITLMVLEMMKRRAENILAIFGPPKQTGVSSSSLFLVSLLKTITQVKQSLKTLEEDAQIESNQNMQEEYVNGQIKAASSNRVWLITKHLHYVEAVGAFVVDYCNNHADEVAKGSSNVRNLLLNTVETMRPTLEVLGEQERIQMFSTLLKPVADVNDEAIRYRLCVHYVTICSYLTTPHELADLIVAVNESITIVSPKCAIYMLECFIQNYLDLNGDLDFLVAHLSTLSDTESARKESEPPAEVYGQALVQSRSSLVLLVHIYGRLEKATVPEVCTRKYVCHLVSQCAAFRFVASQQADDEVKVLLLWFKLFALLTNQDAHVNRLESLGSGNGTARNPTSSKQPAIINLSVNSVLFFLSQVNVTSSSRIVLDLADENLNLSVRTLYGLAKSIHTLVEESMSRPLFSLFWKSNKQSSNNCLFLLECLVLHGVCTTLETYFPETLDYNANLDQGSLMSSDSGSQTSLNSPNKSSDASNFSDALKMKLKTDLFTLYKASSAQLKVTMKKDKSFADLWPLIDQMFGIFAEHALRLAKEPRQALAILNSNAGEDGDDDAARTRDNDSLMGQSFDIEEKFVLDQQLRSIERRFHLQKKRFDLIQQWFVHFYADKNWINCFV